MDIDTLGLVFYILLFILLIQLLAAKLNKPIHIMKSKNTKFNINIMLFWQFHFVLLMSLDMWQHLPNEIITLIKL